ncbi:MAG: peptidoglycan binding domain-containing protein, partial [Chloroflexota bacterium]
MSPKAPPTRALQRLPAPTVNGQQRFEQTRREPAPTQYGFPTGQQQQVTNRPPAPPQPNTPLPQGYAPVPPRSPNRLPARPKTRRRQPNLLAIGLIAMPLGMMALVGMIVVIGAFFILGGKTALPGVSAAGVELGGLTAPEAAEQLRSGWTLTLSDGERQIPVDPAALGITLDAQATAQQAVTYGRGHGDLLRALLGNSDLPPVINMDINATEQGLLGLRDQIEQAPVNAGITLVNGVVQPRDGVIGKAFDLNATLAPLRQNASAALADGVLELVMHPVAPQVSDSSALVQAAGALLAHPLQISLYDPIGNSGRLWTVAPETWSTWLVANGSNLTFDAGQLTPYLTQKQSELAAGDYLDADESVAALQSAIAQRDTNPQVRIYHHDRQHTVEAGDTLISVAWDYGMPYPWIQQANPGVETLSIGQTITIPSPDVMLPLPVTPNKRIVVNMSEQRVRVYENGALKWDWLGSTGIASSPTWRGVYQIISHETNAYASNWDLWMPNFMGV